MGLLTFESCCFIFPLKTGTKIIGWLSLVASILVFILAVIASRNIAAHAHDADVDLHRATTLKYFMWIVISNAAVSTIFSAILLFGVYQNRENLVLSYVILSGICILINLIQVIVTLTSIHDKSLAITGIISACFQIYFFLVVRSYYHSMDGGS